MRKISLGVAALLLFFMFTAVPKAKAFEIRHDTLVQVEADEKIDGNFYCAGQSVTINGQVNGDVICAGQTLKVNGLVMGDVIGAAQAVEVNGTVQGNVRVAGSTVSIGARIGRNLMTVAATNSLTNTADIGWEALVAGANNDIKGKIGRSLLGAGSVFNLSGEIGKDATIYLDSNQGDKYVALNVAKEAKINGNLEYTSTKKATVSNGSTISGEVKQVLPKPKETKSRDRGYHFPLGIILCCVFSSLLIGLLMIAIFKSKISEILETFSQKPELSIGIGLLIMVLFPFLFFILMITFFGIPLALLLLALFFSAMLVGKIIAAMVIGKYLLGKISPLKQTSLYWSLATGAVFVGLLWAIPVLGPLVCLITVWWGLGGWWMWLRR